MADETPEEGANRILKDASKLFGSIGDGITAAYKKFVSATGDLMTGLDTQASNAVATLGQSREYAEGIRTSLADAVPELAQIQDGLYLWSTSAACIAYSWLRANWLEQREKNHFIRVDPPEWQEALRVLDQSQAEGTLA